MGVAEDVLRSAMRFSFGPDRAPAEIDEAAERVAAAVCRARSSEV
jgi:cysteine sulfinate desulfinase/cysteine desulfurase-like protein